MAKGKRFSLVELRRAYPFHEIFFRDEALLAFKLQRSIVTVMGQRLYPPIAKFIALERFQEVHLNYTLTSKLDVNQCNQIEEMITQLRTGKLKPNHFAERHKVLSASGWAKARHFSYFLDFFIEDFPEGPFYAEIKTPLPKLDICAESKKKLLYFWAIRQSQNIKIEE